MRIRQLTAVLAVLLPLVAATPALADTARPASAAASACALPSRTGWTDEGHDTDRAQFQQPLGTKHAMPLLELLNYRPVQADDLG